MRNNISPIVEGGLLAAVSVVLGLGATYLPIIGIAIEFFCAVPFVILTVRQGVGKGLTALIVSLMLMAMFMGPLLAARLALTINICGIILGRCIQKNFSTAKCFVATFISSVAAQTIAIIFVMAVMGINFTETQLSLMKESFDQSFQIYESMGVEKSVIEESKKQIEPAIQLISFLVPTIVVLISLINTTACYLTSKWIFQKLRFQFIEALPKFSEWRFSIFFLYLAAFAILGTYWGGTRNWNLIYVVSLNAIFLAMGVGLIQGLSVLSFAADKHNFSKFARRLAFILIIISPLFLQITSCIGLFDMIFDYRKKLLS